jgi:hypothetical protein
MSTPKKFRKKPVVIEALRWDGTAEGAIPIIDWILATGQRAASYDDGDPGVGVPESLRIETLEGTMRAEPGDWIIRGVQGEFYPCKPDIFIATYEGVFDD